MRLHPWPIVFKWLLPFRGRTRITPLLYEFRLCIEGIIQSVASVSTCFGYPGTKCLLIESWEVKLWKKKNPERLQPIDTFNSSKKWRKDVLEVSKVPRQHILRQISATFVDKLTIWQCCHIHHLSEEKWKSVRPRAVGRPPDFSEKTQTEVVMVRHTIIWTGQDYPTGNSSRRETKRQTEETMGRQY